MKTINVTALGVVEVCELTASGQHYNCFAPGQDVSGQSAEIQAACEGVHTPEVVAAYQARQEQERAQMQALRA